VKLFSGHGWWVFWVGRGERVGRIVCVCVCMSDESPFFFSRWFGVLCICVGYITGSITASQWYARQCTSPIQLVNFCEVVPSLDSTSLTCITGS